MKIIPVSPFDYVVFGGAGDLALRKLYPSLLRREADGQLPTDARIIGASRSAKADNEFRELVKQHCEENLGDSFPADVWETFAKRLSYCKIDATTEADYKKLKTTLDQHKDRVRVFYLAMSPALFGATAENLHAVGLHKNDSRIVLEKPVGRDLPTFREIDDQVGKFFSEEQIYRIDHYLGKETVQNLTALRFSNILFANVWNADNIDHIQITAAETVGLGERAGYYDKYGAMRDMVQNHLLQLLCLVAMEPPAKFDQDSLRDEKLKVLKALRRWKPENLNDVVFGQYAKGMMVQTPVPGYTDELGKDSHTETFVALKTYIDNWRWSGVPIYLRTGKRMEVKHSEIVIQFKQVPHSIFGDDMRMAANRLVLRLQPDEGVSLELMTKDPGPGGMRLRQAGLDLSFQQEFDVDFPDAYERLLLDVVRGNSTLFMRRDEVEAAWSWIGPLLEHKENSNEAPKPYKAGSWGPKESGFLIYQEGNQWNEDL